MVKAAIIGGGNLGGAFAAGWRDMAGLALWIVEPDVSKHAQWRGWRGVTLLRELAALPAGLDVVVVAVKPALVPETVSALRALAPKTVVSFAAGVPLALLRQRYGSGGKLVRAMGNTAAALRASTTTLVAEAGGVSKTLLGLFAWLGAVVTVQNEAELDAAMAVSASAPAFLLLAAEGLSDGGVKLGLKREVADVLAAGALRAAAAVAVAEPGAMTAARHRVTSPGGTTIAGLTVLERAAVRAAFNDATAATVARGVEMAAAATAKGQR